MSCSVSKPTSNNVCDCGIKLDPKELAAVWFQRAQPTLVRLMKNHHIIDQDKLTQTMSLLAVLEQGQDKAPEAYDNSVGNSHHALWCRYRHPTRQK